MDKKQTLHIIESLANGIDSTTGEVFPDNSPYQNVEIVRALFHATKLLSSSKQKELPTNAGNPWSEEEHNQVIQAFQDGFTITQIAKNHQRTYGAIRSTIKKAGLLD